MSHGSHGIQKCGERNCESLWTNTKFWKSIQLGCYYTRFVWFLFVRVFLLVLDFEDFLGGGCHLSLGVFLMGVMLLQ